MAEHRDWPEQLAALRAHYKLVTVNLTVAEQPLELVKVENIDDLLDRVSEPDQIPFWAELWPASIGLARYLLMNRAKVAALQVLELGCGVGLAGIAAKLAGAEVVQSDFCPDALEFARVNCLRNGVPAGEFLLADWRRFPAEAGRFDRLIGADILYEKTLHADLYRIFHRHLRPAGEIWLTDPGREWAKQFIAGLSQEWRVIQTAIPVVYENKTCTIDLYRLSMAGNQTADRSL